MYFEFYDYSIHITETMFLAVGHERGFLEFDNEKVDLAIRTTRVFILHEHLWKQLHHHGSMNGSFKEIVIFVFSSSRAK